MSITRALKVAFDTDEVEKTDSVYVGEQVYRINDSNASIFDSVDEAKEFYRSAFESLMETNPAGLVMTFNQYLGQNIWLNYISKARIIKAIMKLIRGDEELDEELKAKIVSSPVSVMKSWFNLSSSKEKDAFYAFVFENSDKDLISDTVEAMLKTAKTKRFYDPDDDEYKTAIVW